MSGKEIFLPDTGERADNLIIAAMGVLAKKLDYTVSLIPYGDRKITTLVDAMEQQAIGISFTIMDFERKLLIRNKTDNYETGRTIARAQQTIGLFTSIDWLGQEALKRSQRWFGNNPNETEGKGRAKVKVDYVGRDFSHFFVESEWASQLAHLLGQLLRKSHTLLSGEVVEHIINENILSWSECVSHFSTIHVAKDKRRSKGEDEKQERIPRKPRQNALLLKEEMDLLDRIITPLFKSREVADKQAFLEIVKSSGFTAIRRELRTSATERAEFLQKFASLTTKRLNEVRKNLTESKSKRKRDVTSDDVTTTLRRRETPVREFALEIQSLDSSYRKVLLSYRRENSDRTLNAVESFRALYNDVHGSGLRTRYNELEIRDSPVRNTEEASNDETLRTTDDAVVYFDTLMAEKLLPEGAKDFFTDYSSIDGSDISLDGMKRVTTWMRQELRRRGNMNLPRDELKAHLEREYRRAFIARQPAAKMPARKTG